MKEVKALLEYWLMFWFAPDYTILDIGCPMLDIQYPNIGCPMNVIYIIQTDFLQYTYIDQIWKALFVIAGNY